MIAENNSYNKEIKKLKKEKKMIPYEWHTMSVCACQ